MLDELLKNEEVYQYYYLKPLHDVVPVSVEELKSLIDVEKMKISKDIPVPQYDNHFLR